MSNRFFKKIITGVLLLVLTGSVKAQSGLCPSNLNFELGDFTGWECSAGQIVQNPLPITGPIPGRHTIITTATAGTDPFGSFPTLCPNGSGVSVMLGNHSTGSQSESISYTYTIPSTLTVFSMLFFYAVVLEAPGHTPANQPRFQAKIIDLSTNLPLPCVDFDFIAGSVGGFQTSPFLGNLGTQVQYKDWTPVSVNLNAYIGRTIKLEFITRDCSQNGHAGYAYLDVSTACNGAISGATICQGENSITLTAPFGFQNYEWFSDATFTTSIATTQMLVMNPAPAVGSVIPVIVDPYPGFGCRDTLYATINVAAKPVSVAGPDMVSCKFNNVLIGGPDNPIHTYEWTPASQVNNPLISNPFAWNIPPAPTQFIVKTTDILTGCFSYDTTIVSSAVVDTAMRLTGVTTFCNYGTPGATLSVNPASSAIQWFENLTPVPGANGPTYQPLVSGSYWAQLTQNGCTDSTARIAVTVNRVPTALFNPLNTTLCVDGGAIRFTNQSLDPDGNPMTFNWKFSDGTTMQTVDALKTFPGIGNYNIELVATTANGCKDSLVTSIIVFPNGVPDFKWDSICVDRPVQFVNLSNEVGAAVVNYNWNFNNGSPAVLVKDPPPTIYSTAGTFDVILEMTSAGCETAPKTIRKTVRVNASAPGTRYRTVTVPEGSTAFLHARERIGDSYLWKPQQQLTTYTTQYTEFIATGNDVMYNIEIINPNTCVTIDTVLMQILKKPGYYLPTGFTPNGDGLNDILRPYLVGMKGLKSFSIFNRWGSLVFRSTTAGEGWDGKFKGLDQNPGVYIWILEFIDGDSKPVREKGTVTIIR